MMISKNNFKINNQSVDQYVTSIKFGYHKLWGKDSGRNMAMAVTGSFKLFPKFTLTFKRLDKAGIDKWSKIINAQTQTVSYYDPDKGVQKSIQTYTGDLEYVQENLHKLDKFDIAFIARKARQ